MWNHNAPFCVNLQVINGSVFLPGRAQQVVDELGYEDRLPARLSPVTASRMWSSSQEEFVHRIDVDRTYVSALECCLYAARVYVLERLARGLGVEPATC